MAVAFLEVLVEDCYGITAASNQVKTVLDIGANVGIFSLAARRACPSALIHAYEPNAELEQWLRVQAAVARCHYFLEAVTKDGGSVRLDIHPDSVRTRAHPDVTGDVPAVSLRTAVGRLGGFVDFAKIDCEGCEWDLFQDRRIWDRFACLSLEYHLFDQLTHEHARDTVESIGFKIVRQQPADGFGLIRAERIK
jgi:FkbM family methyltransferase